MACAINVSTSGSTGGGLFIGQRKRLVAITYPMAADKRTPDWRGYRFPGPKKVEDSRLRDVHLRKAHVERRPQGAHRASALT